SNDAFEGRQVEALLESAIRRWRRSSYERGTILDDRYELIRDVGGRVAGSRWEVRHRRTARRSLVKIGVRIGGDDSDAQAVRRAEVALASFIHPGATDFRDSGTTALGDPYIVLEMLEGRSLEGIVAARGALRPADAYSVVRQIASVLAAAHEAGIRHNAVRPENVLIVRDAWGVERAKLVHWEEATMAEGRDAMLDLTGIGACAFLALAGRMRDESEDVRSIRSGRWAPAATPTALATVVSRTLRGAGADRFTAVKDFIAALDQAAPDLGEGIALLDAKPEFRGTWVRPQPRSARSLPPPNAPSETARKSAEFPTESRRFSRAPYHTPVRIEVPGIGDVDGRTEDISERGLFVVTRGKIAEGASVNVRFALPLDGKLVTESGVVRWTSAPPASDSGGTARALGIELPSPAEDSVRQIARYVAAALTTKWSYSAAVLR
ncbi:MAG TPA: PilZ domain-containing protein, partial [Labilithrix sp.]|nr:PilZ domain-containing protein [Labilithrix sp.]